MADRAKEVKRLHELESERIQFAQDYLSLLSQEYDQYRAIYDVAYRNQQAAEATMAAEELHAAQVEEINRLKEDGIKISKDINKELDEQNKNTKEVTESQKKYNKALKVAEATMGEISGLAKLTWEYLMQADKAMKSTILTLGMSGEKAAMMTQSFMDSAGHVARLGGNLGDVEAIMTGFANETGMARVLTADMVIDITKMAKGTAMGVENATKLAAQFEYMGYDVKNTMEYVQGVVETSELMGINTAKVLDNINTNFKELQKYTFNKGVKGFASMAQYAEKFSINMSEMLSATDQARGLENVIDMAANLQIMGGEFAKSDPFRMFYLSRNDPDGYMEMINNMTKGLVTFRKVISPDGKTTFEKYISPADRDRINSVAKTLGLSTAEITEQTLRMADISKMRQDMVGAGFTAREKAVVEGMGKYDTNLGRYVVTIAGHKKDIVDLTHSEIELLEKTKSSLEDRALHAQTFDEAFKNTIEEMKTVLLPLLKGVNAALEWLRPHAIKFSEWVTGLVDGGKQWVKVAGILLASGFLLNKAFMFAGRVMGSARNIGLAGGGGSVASSGARARSSRGAASALKRGKGTMMGGAGVGAAALGIGAGIGLAAAGIGELADAMSNLDAEQAEVLKDIVQTLGISIGIMGVAAAGIMVFGTASSVASVGLLAFGGAIMLIGVGIGAAAFGISKIATGMAEFATASKGSGKDMAEIAVGIGEMAISFGAAGLSLPAAIALKSTLKGISKYGKDIGKISSLNKLTELKGMSSDFLAVEKMVRTISTGNLRNLRHFSAIGDLKDLLSKPLKVEFAQKEVAVVSNVSLNIAGYKFYETTNGAAQIAIDTTSIQQGKL